MNDKDRELIQQILQTAGETGQQGFAYMVHYRFVDGATDVVGALICLFLCIYGLRWLWTSEKVKSFEDEGFVRFLGTCVGCFGILIFLWATLSGVTVMLAPEGAAIHSMLHDIGASK